MKGRVVTKLLKLLLEALDKIQDPKEACERRRQLQTSSLNIPLAAKMTALVSEATSLSTTAKAETSGMRPMQLVMGYLYRSSSASIQEYLEETVDQTLKSQGIKKS